ncbi:MAG: formyl-CoA transferase [Rhodospirillaceae bacterium]|nr:formyl-CoA transferase [Rhodospirillaceae bacterium]
MRVQDFTHVLSGPFAAYQLSGMGADVIKIEPPGTPDMMRDQDADPVLSDQGLGTGFTSQNAGKSSLVLDLPTSEGLVVAERLAEDADVRIENYRAGKLEALGLGCEAVAAIRPDIIYCSMTGFGQTGPKRRHPAYDPVIKAYSGLMAANGTADHHPTRVGPPLIDCGTGAQGSFAIASALFQRCRTGKSQRIDVAMADAALMIMSMPVMATQALGRTPPPFGSVTPGQAGYSCYETAEGLIFLGAATVQQYVNLLRALGEEALADERAGMTRQEIADLAEQDMGRLTEILAARTADEWEAIINERGVPAAQARRMDEALAEPQTATRGVVAASEIESDGGPLSLPVAAFGCHHDGPALAGLVPRHGEHSRQVLEEAGLSASEIVDLIAGGAVLQS